jgi:hypothetical protein
MHSKEYFEQILLKARQVGEEAIVGMSDTFPCGGAYHTADGNSTIVRAFKKYGTMGALNTYEFGEWYAMKSYKGYMIGHRGGKLTRRGYQSMNMHSARATAESGMLGVSGFITSVHTYID